jgi:hypothetical protein
VDFEGCGKKKFLTSHGNRSSVEAVRLLCLKSNIPVFCNIE